MIKAVLFDLDGTLVNSLCDLAFAVNEGLKKYGFPERETSEFERFVGNGISKTIERALPHGFKTDENLKKVKEVFSCVYKQHFDDKTYAYNGVPQAVKDLKSKGFKLAVVTNKSQKMAELVVTKFYGDSFDCIIGKRDGIPSKPDPQSALTAINELGVKPFECVFVGDSEVDIMTGLNSGAVPIGVLWGFRKREELEAKGAKYIINTPKEIENVIGELNNNV